MFTLENGLTFDIANGVAGISSVLVEGNNNMSFGGWTTGNAPSNSSIYLK
jgi:hypothetical protein